MTSETETWKLEKDLCRCCHAEGCFQNLGQRCSNSNELLSDMLRTCFDIEISPVTGLLCALTFTICEQCVERLRDASSFKHQVLRCEERFKHMYRNLGKVLNPDIAVKLEEEPSTLHNDVKEEPSAEEDDFDVNFAVDDDDDDEDDDKTVLALQLEAAQKAKRGKAKEKKAPPKAKRKGKSEAPAESNAEEKPKRGYASQFTLIVTDDGERQFTCNTCGKVFHKRVNFTQHYSHVHLKQRPKMRACHMCQEKYLPYRRAQHMEQVHGVTPPTCNACGKKFAYDNQVLRHQKLYHMHEKNFACDQCDLVFATKSRLVIHKVKHTSVRQYRCEYCEKTFRWKNNLRTHMLMHLNVRNHACKACGEAFVQWSSLSYHMKKRHPEID